MAAEPKPFYNLKREGIHLQSQSKKHLWYRKYSGCIRFRFNRLFIDFKAYIFYINLGVYILCNYVKLYTKLEGKSRLRYCDERTVKSLQKEEIEQQAEKQKRPTIPCSSK
jgi:hypothetical protein